MKKQLDFYIADMQKYYDGEVFEISGRHFIKCGVRCLLLNDLLAWDGLEEEMKKLPQSEAPVSHTLSGGVYVREMFIAKGTFIIGKRHRHETCNILLKGKLSVYLGDNKPVQIIEGPLIMTSEPMTRKIAYCHEDAIFLNVHPTAETDIEKIEKEFIIAEEEASKCLGAQ